MAGFTGGLEVFVIQGMIQNMVEEAHTLFLLPDRNNDALQRERKAPVCYDIQEGLRLARNPAHHAYEFRRIHFVDVFDKTPACINKGDASGGWRSTWAPVPHGRDCRSKKIDAWAWRGQGKGPGTIPSEIVRASFNGTYSPQFQQPLWGREEEWVHG